MPAGMMEKLQVKPGQTLVLVNPPKGMREALSNQLSGVSLESDLSGQPDGALAFLHTKAEALALTPEIFKSVKSASLVWLAYPKGGSGVPTDLNRDLLWAVLQESGWRPVRNVAIDEAWSALRFRPSELVGR